MGTGQKVWEICQGTCKDTNRFQNTWKEIKKGLKPLFIDQELTWLFLFRSLCVFIVSAFFCAAT